MAFELIEQLKKEDLDTCKGDRLCMAKKLFRILNALHFSLKGWDSWMTIEKVDNLTKEDMEWAFPRLRKLIIAFLEIDYKITKKKEDELRKLIEIEDKKEKALIKKIRKAERTKKKYIA